MTHERCSELLLPYERGDLAPPERAEVEEHLGSCDECSAELRALEALLAPVDNGLTDLERRRLHARVGDAAPDTSAARAGATGEKVGRWLGVAAVVAVLAVGVATVRGGLFDATGDDESADTIEAGGDDGGAGAEGAPSLGDFRGPSPVFHDRLGIAADATSSELAEGEEGAVRTNSDEATLKEERRLLTLASYPALRRFSASYSDQDVPALQEEFIAQLTDQAPDSVRSEVEACSQQVLESQPFPVLPAYGALDESDGDPILVLAFVWSDDAGGPLNRYQVWTWPLGDCDAPPDYEAGRIPQR